MDHTLLDGGPGRGLRMPGSLPLPDPVPVRHARPAADGGIAFAPRSRARLEDRQFEIIEQAFARHGGMATADGVARLMRCRSDQPISELARWLVDRRVVQIRWQGHTLLPMFQFDREHMTLRAGVAEAVQALADANDDWDIALWFATPNRALGNESPVESLRRDPASVADAARADPSRLHD